MLGRWVLRLDAAVAAEGAEALAALQLADAEPAAGARALAAACRFRYESMLEVER